MLLTKLSGVSLEEEDYRVRHVRDQQASGLTVAEYCQQHGLCAGTFYAWRRRWCDGPVASEPVSFTEIGRLAAERPQWAAEVVLAGGTIVRVDGSAGAQLLRTLFEALG